MNHFGRNIIHGLTRQENVAMLRRLLLEKFESGEQVRKYLDDHIEQAVVNFCDRVSNEIMTSDPLPGTSLQIELTEYNKQFLGEQIAFISSYIASPGIVHYSIGDGMPTAQTNYNVSADTLLRQWRYGPRHGVTAREDPQGDVYSPMTRNNRPIINYDASRYKKMSCEESAYGYVDSGGMRGIEHMAAKPDSEPIGEGARGLAPQYHYNQHGGQKCMQQGPAPLHTQRKYSVDSAGQYSAPSHVSAMEIPQFYASVWPDMAAKAGETCAPTHSYFGADNHIDGAAATSTSMLNYTDMSTEGYNSSTWENQYTKSMNDASIAVFGDGSTQTDLSLLNRRIFRSENGVESGIPFYLRTVQHRHLDRDVDEGLRGTERGYMRQSHDMASLYARTNAKMRNRVLHNRAKTCRDTKGMLQNPEVNPPSMFYDSV